MKILITRPRNQAEQLASGLQAAGFESHFFPVIQIQPLETNPALECALRRLERYDWLVFTSVNAVETVWKQMECMLITSLPARLRVAAIGPKTAQRLRACGIEPDFVPQEYVAEAILPGLGELAGRWVLLPRAEVARKVLPQAISTAGGVVHEISVYQTVPAKADMAGLAALKAGVDVVTLTSPSTVHNFVYITHQHGLDPQQLPGSPVFACIGPITAQAARDEGLGPLVVAPEYTAEGLVQAISTIQARM
ncbi:MAG TPA: uroporphyrinogen-III synthase [Anaerolineales bacterium]|jgi:uroporphyrinogen-III synthase